jgi:hypothetical protein
MAGLQRAACLVQRLVELADALARLVQALFERTHVRLQASEVPFFALRLLADRLQRGLHTVRSELRTIATHLFLPLHERCKLIVQLLDARLLDNRLLSRLAELCEDGVPGCLPRCELQLGFRLRGSRARLDVARRRERRIEARERGGLFLQLSAIVLEVLAEGTRALFELLQLALSLLPEVARMLDRLFQACNLGAVPIVVLLNSREGLVVLDLRRAGTLDLRLDVALLGEDRLDNVAAFLEQMLLLACLDVDRSQLQCNELCVQPALALLELLVLLGELRLLLEVRELAADFFAKISQALEILTRVADAQLGLAPAVLVARDSGSLLEVAAHLFGARFDEARDHALLDDGIAAWPEARAEKEVRDVLAPAAGTVQVITRGAVARQRAPHGNFGVVGVAAADRTVVIVEHELDRRHAHRFARARAVENDVLHRLAAQRLRGALAHDPAHGVDDVRLTAAVGTDDAGEIARELDDGGIDERLESGQLDLAQTHAAVLNPYVGEGGGSNAFLAV